MLLFAARLTSTSAQTPAAAPAPGAKPDATPGAASGGFFDRLTTFYREDWTGTLPLRISRLLRGVAIRRLWTRLRFPTQTGRMGDRRLSVNPIPTLIP